MQYFQTRQSEAVDTFCASNTENCQKENQYTKNVRETGDKMSEKAEQQETLY